MSLLKSVTDLARPSIGLVGRARLPFTIYGYEGGMPSNENDEKFAPLPATLERSPKKARDTYEATLESAEKSYDGDQAAAHRVAWKAVKHSFEKVGDHWEAKDEKGPSDELSKAHGPHAKGASYGGVDVEGKTKPELLEEARALGAGVTARMTKAEIGDRIALANRRADQKAREAKR